MTIYKVEVFNGGERQENFLNSFLIPTRATSIYEPPGYDGG